MGVSLKSVYTHLNHIYNWNRKFPAFYGLFSLKNDNCITCLLVSKSMSATCPCVTHGSVTRGCNTRKCNTCKCNTWKCNTLKFKCNTWNFEFSLEKTIVLHEFSFLKLCRRHVRSMSATCLQHVWKVQLETRRRGLYSCCVTSLLRIIITSNKTVA